MLVGVEKEEREKEERRKEGREGGRNICVDVVEIWVLLCALL